MAPVETHASPNYGSHGNRSVLKECIRWLSNISRFTYIRTYRARVYSHSRAHLYNSLLKLFGSSKVSGSRNVRIFSTNSPVTSLICVTCALIVRGCIMGWLTLERKSCQVLPWLKTADDTFRRRTLYADLHTSIFDIHICFSAHSVKYRACGIQGGNR